MPQKETGRRIAITSGELRTVTGTGAGRMQRKIMKIQREINREYEAEFFPDAFDCTVGDFIRQRERLRLPVLQFKRCFICGKRLRMDRKPIVISVSGKGNRFACDACYKKYEGGKTGEKAEL